MSKPSWDNYFLNIARTVSQRASCPRAQVGAVLVVDNRIIATGYNGAPPGEPECVDVGCDMADDHCVRVVHAEKNAWMQVENAGRGRYILHRSPTMYVYFKGVEPASTVRYRLYRRFGGTFNISDFPCSSCRALLVDNGISRALILYTDGAIVEFGGQHG